MQRVFVEYPGFQKLTEAGFIDDKQLKQIQKDIMNGAGQTIQGTGGFKKMRCRGKEYGKRGGLRVIFTDYPKYNIVLLIDAFAKTEKGNLSQEERNLLKKLKAELDKHLRNIYGAKKEKTQ